MKYSVYICFILLILTLGFSENIAFGEQKPIILVHGFLGWGRDEMLGYKYWGGIVVDIESYLTEKGFVVYTASVGAISSNHDRACELFYQIKGGRVDYGISHAAEYRHKRYGATYDNPLYPQWDANHPVHLVGHSMGGQTARMLVELLAQDYFKVGSSASWVKSVSTISTPNNGTTLAIMANQFTGGYAEEILSSFAGLIGSDTGVYNFDMDQWDLKRKPGESIHDFFTRVDKLLGDTKDIAIYEFTPQGAAEFNQNVKTYPEVYYFGYGTEETYVLNPLTGHELGKPTMNPLFWGYAYAMGSYEGDAVSPNKEWWKNDGLVNTISMKGPFNATIQNYDGTPRPGIWNDMGVTEKDHGKIIGHYELPALNIAKLFPRRDNSPTAKATDTEKNWLKVYYIKIAELLASLP